VITEATPETWRDTNHCHGHGDVCGRTCTRENSKTNHTDTHGGIRDPCKPLHRRDSTHTHTHTYTHHSFHAGRDVQRQVTIFVTTALVSPGHSVPRNTTPPNTAYHAVLTPNPAAAQHVLTNHCWEGARPVRDLRPEEWDVCSACKQTTQCRGRQLVQAGRRGKACPLQDDRPHHTHPFMCQQTVVDGRLCYAGIYPIVGSRQQAIHVAASSQHDIDGQIHLIGTTRAAKPHHTHTFSP